MGKGLMHLREALISGLEKAIDIQQSSVTGYVGWLRRRRPDATPTEVINVLEKRYLTAVTGTGAAVGGVAAAPGVGTGLALALSGAETAVFLGATALLALAVAEVHSIQVEDVERRRTLVLAIVLDDHGAMLVEKIAGQAGQHWGELLPDAIPMSSITAVNRVLSHWFLTKYGHRRQIMAIGRIAPFGTGAAIGAGGNRALGRTVIKTSHRIFGPAPTSFADQLRGLC